MLNITSRLIESNAFLKSTKQIVKSLSSLFISSIIWCRANICEIVDHPPLKPFWLLRSSGSTEWQCQVTFFRDRHNTGFRPNGWRSQGRKGVVAESE